MIPEKYASMVARLVHDDYGCGSTARMVNTIRPFLDCPGVEKEIKKLRSGCPMCMAAGQKNVVAREMKEVKVPDRILDEILVDEIHRDGPRGESWKFLVGSDCLSRFMVIIAIPHKCNAKQFAYAIDSMMEKFSRPSHNDDPVTLKIRCDDLSVHVAAKSNDLIKHRNIAIEMANQLQP